MQFENMKVNCHDQILRIMFDSTDHKNKINALLITQLLRVLKEYDSNFNIIILEGNKDFFCTGADFNESDEQYHPEKLYELWYRLATGPFITISHVKGNVMAGGMGFIGASDIVIADAHATFCLTELLFGIYPAMVLPFIIRKAGFGRANYMALTTGTLTAGMAAEKGIVDVWGKESSRLLARHLLRLSKVPKAGIEAYKSYMEKINPILRESNQAAVSANIAMFQNEENKKRIQNFALFGKYPWES